MLWTLSGERAVSAQDVANVDYLPVAYCDLMLKPDEYDGRRVSVYASYRYGFEWQELLCMRCSSLGRTWLEFPTEPPEGMRRVLRKAPRWQGTLNGTFKGVFRAAPRSFGDGGYRFQLDLELLTDVKVISRSGGVPESLKESERKRLCAGGSIGR